MSYIIPSRRTKKWTTSFKGESLGDIVRSFMVDLFSSPSRVKAGTKMYPHSTTSTTPPSAFAVAKILSGASRVAKVWAVAGSKKIVRTALSTLAAFSTDTGTGFGTSEATGDGSDLVSVGDETGEDLVSTILSIPEGTGAFSITGQADTVKWAQSFSSVGGPFSALSLLLKKIGSPVDNLAISIQEDTAGAPSGTPLITIDVGASLLTSAFVLHELLVAEFTPTALQLDVSKTYWLVFERDGSADASSYFRVNLVQSDTDPYERGQLLSYNGTTWTRTVIHRRVDTFTANGNWTVPAAVTEALVEAWAPGGGGSTNVGGGGGGAYARKTLTVVPTDVHAVVVPASVANTDASDTTFGTTLVVAKGGKSGTNGGTGGQASASTGDTKFNGGDGGLGTGDRSGGGGAGDVSAGSPGDGSFNGIGGSNNGGQGVIATNGRAPGGGGGSKTASQNRGGRGELRVTYDIAVTAGFPVVRARSWGNTVIKSNSHSVTVPVGTMAGELLLVALSFRGPTTFSGPTGWTKLAESTDLLSLITQAVFWKRADGDETTATFTSSGTAECSSHVAFRIYNASTPVASTTRVQGANANPPGLSMPESMKYLWIVAVAFNGRGDISVSAQPTDYYSFVTAPENGVANSDGTVNNSAQGGKTCVAERHLEAISEDPGTFTSDSTEYVASTIAVPPAGEDDELFYDAALAIQVTYPEAEERLYLTTTEDVKFLNIEDGVWQSLWRGILGQDALETAYPHPMKSIGAGGVLLVGDGNKLHSMLATAVDPADAQPARLTFDLQYYIAWIQVTKSAVFLGLNHKESELLPSFVCYYEPFSETTRLYEIREGATVGWVEGENCRILDKAGQMRYFTGSAFDAYDYFPPFYRKERISTLPHRNGIREADGQVEFLWEGQYPDPAGVWVHEDGRLYHRKGLVFSQTALNSLAAMEGADNWRAIIQANGELFAGASVKDSSLATVEGIFSTKNLAGSPVSTEARGSFRTSRFESPGIDDRWQRVHSKIEDRPSGTQTGSVVMKQRTEKSVLDDLVAYTGTWTAPTIFKCSTAAFQTAVDNGTIKAGDEVIVRTGQGAGLLAHIVSITGAAASEKTVTIDSGLAAISSGSFTFSIENWRKLADNKPIVKDADWLQLKVEIRDKVELEEVQVGTAGSRPIDE